MRRSAPRRRPGAGGVDPRMSAPLLDELRLAAPGTYRAALRGVLARAPRPLPRRGDELAVDEALLGEAANRFFLERGTLSPGSIQAWMAAERLDAEGLGALPPARGAVYRARTLHRGGASSIGRPISCGRAAS